MARLALFDFDGTITDRDSFTDFLRYSFGNLHFLYALAVLSPVLLLYSLGIMSNWRAKAIVIRWFFTGMPVDEFSLRVSCYIAERLPNILRPQAMERLRAHREAGDEVIVVSALPELTLEPWCRAQGVRLLATRLVSSGGMLTGQIDGRNCYGPEKTRRIREFLDLEGYEHITAYGDSRGDREMLALAHERYYRGERMPGPDRISNYLGRARG